MKRELKLLSGALLLLFASGSVAALDEQPRWFKACGKKCETQSERLQSVGLKLKKRVVRLAAPPYPPSCGCQGTVVVQVLVNPEGKVECARIMQGHPLFTCAVLNVADEWEFMPLEVGGERVPYTGLLLIEFSSDGRVSFKK